MLDIFMYSVAIFIYLLHIFPSGYFQRTTEYPEAIFYSR
ncbi:putative membrane protein [Escherichia coli DEC5B]|nr:putative membrane protein [Escherichia coli DEC5B]